MSWKTQGCYLWRTRKPHALFGFSLRWCLLAGVVVGLGLWALHGPWWLALCAPLFSGRHNAYAGVTKSRYFRDRQHLYGDSRYGTAPKPWADLAPKCYPLPVLFPSVKWARHGQEKLWIWLLLPVYNVEYNKKNPRRISSTKAQQQRWQRDSRKPAAKLAISVGRFAFAALVWGAISYGGWQLWIS